MKSLDYLAEWLNIRPTEIRAVFLSFAGAFLVIGFLVAARSLREALYLTSFDITTLPYITAATAVLSLPTVGIFSRLLARHPARTVLRAILLLLMAGILLIWPVIKISHVAVVVFYLWTTLGTLVMTSGFWIITSELFLLRSAKRLFALIAAGGTSGAMIVGTSLSWVTDTIDIFWLVPGIALFIAALVGTQMLLPKPSGFSTEEAKREPRASVRDSLRQIWERPHLRTIGLIVMMATMATTLLDYQFKDLVRMQLETKEALTGFFGAFYGWTGAASLFIQLFVGARLITAYGIGWALSILPLIVLLGSAGFLVLPSLWLITLVRGADNSLRKSLHRSVLEVLFVPVPSLLRRKTKTFIDSVLDSIAEGIGAGLIFFWVTWGNLPAVYLSYFIIGFTALFLILNRVMNYEYVQTLLKRLKEGQATVSALARDERIIGRDLLTASMSHLDMTRGLKRYGLHPEEYVPAPQPFAPSAQPMTSAKKLQATDADLVLEGLSEIKAWEPQHVPALLQLLARDRVRQQVAELLAAQCSITLPALAAALSDENQDFVIRRRIPHVLANIEDAAADEALVAALFAKRFEVRYHAAVALNHRCQQGLPLSESGREEKLWEAVRHELKREKVVWEMQRLLDVKEDSEGSELVEKQIQVRGQLSLEHTFRILTLLLDPDPVRTAFYAVLHGDEQIKSIALEYLERILPDDIRERLWIHIGDVSEYQRRKAERPLDEVVSDLLKSGATLFASDADKARLKKALDSA